MLDDGCSYRAIAAKLEELGYPGFFHQNIQRWKNGGYQQWVRDTLAAQDLFAAAEPESVRPQDWPPTRYETKALRQNRVPLYWSLRLQSAQC